MKKILTILFVFLLSFSLLATSVSAQYGQYGAPAPSLSITITKLVGKPTITKGGQNNCDSSISFQNNYSPTDPRFSPNDFICFELKVQNTSNATLPGVTVKDFVPPDVEPVSGPGSFDSNTRMITINAGDFAQGQEVDFFFLMQVHNQNQLPVDKGLFCELNKGQAFNANVSDDSSSQFCIEKQVQPITKTPSAGPEMGTLLVTAELSTLGLGLLIKKKFDN